jgi:hypothetical protein
VTHPTTRSYHLGVAGGLLGVERTIGLLRRRRVTVLRLEVDAGRAAEPARMVIQLESANHEQVRRQLARLLGVVIDHERENQPNGPIT